MSSARIADIFAIPGRFMRSAHLERDFADPRALDGYILTPSVQQILGRIIEGLHPTSGRRAWRITGDYGTGKSSFGLLLAHLVTGNKAGLPRSLQGAIRFKDVGIHTPSLLPLLITGTQEGIGVALARAVSAAASALRRPGRMPAELGRIINSLEPRKSGDDAALQALSELHAYVTATGRATGILIVIDELGKFLEFAALNAGASDVYILQRLAEMATRSGNCPVMLVGLLHQGFHAYAEQLPTTAQQEWEKVAGRFEEIIFDQPLEHTLMLSAGALGTSEDALPRGVKDIASKSMNRAVALGWYGPAPNVARLAEMSRRLYPLHPSVPPILLRFLRRFGQHERSMFSFLLSQEPFALQDFSNRRLSVREWYRLHNLYDYVRATYGHGLAGQSHRSHWARIASVIDGAAAGDDLDLATLKTVAILNLLDAEDLPATEDAVVGAVSDDAEGMARASLALQEYKRRSLLFDRGGASGYCLWPHTSVNLDRAFSDASRSLGAADRVAGLIAPFLDTRPVVARRHYVETGTLRHFEVRFVAVESMASSSAVSRDADGLILVPLCESASEERAAAEFACSDQFRGRPTVFVAVPRPLTHLAGVVRDFRCWQWVAENVAELNHDNHAAAEVERQLRAARLKLQKGVEQSTGLRSHGRPFALRWFCDAQELPIRDGRHLLETVSLTCDRVFAAAPRVMNELVNRRALSSAAVKARQQLIQHMLQSSDDPMLGMDPVKAPPEKSIYLSLLARGGLHRDVGGSHAIVAPEPGGDTCNVGPALSLIHGLLARRNDARVKVEEVFAALRDPPFGIRDGLLPLLLVIYLKIHEHELAFYERDSFLIKVGPEEFMRLIKAPEFFEMQFCEVAGVRAALFGQLVALLDVSIPQTRKPHLLDVVTPLCEFAMRLPEYSRKTTAVSSSSRGVREALLEAREPSTLLFRQVPAALGEVPFEAEEPPNGPRIGEFVTRLRAALEELRGAYAALLVRIAAEVGATLDCFGTPSSVREELATRARSALVTIREPRLRAFCLRLADDKLAYEKWVESVGSVVLAKPPSRWSDADAENFADEIRRLAETFRRVETMSFPEASATDRAAMRIVVTRADGMEVDRVVYFSAQDEDAIIKAESRIAEALGSDANHINLAAASRVFLKRFSQEMP